MTTATRARHASTWWQSVEVDRPNDRLVLGVLVHFDLYEGGAFPSYQTVATRTGLAVSTVRQAIYRMAKRGIVLITRRWRGNGSQTTNHYELAMPKAKGGVAGATPHVTPEKATTTAIDKNSLSESRAPHAEVKIQNMDEGQVHGSLPRDDVAPAKARRKGRREKPAVWVPTRRQVEQTLKVMQRRRDRSELPIEDWNANDLANAWRQRLWDKGHRTDLVGMKALAARFRDLQHAGVSNAHLDAMSEAFFTDPRHTAKARGDHYRWFLAQSTALLREVQNPTKGGYYSPTRDINFGTSYWSTQP